MQEINHISISLYNVIGECLSYVQKTPHFGPHYVDNYILDMNS